MSNTAQAQKPKRERSPSFPFISLKAAVGRLAAFEEYFKRHPAPAKQVGLAWGMKGDSSQAAQTLAALKAFGFIDYSGSGESLQASLTDDGRNFLRVQQESMKRDILARAALRPKAIAKYWQTWGADRPPDPVCLDALILKGAFTETAAKLFLTVYDETIAYAKLTDSDKVTIVESESESADAEDVAGASNGEMENEAGSQSDAPQVFDESQTSVQYPKAKSPMLQEIFNLDEGPVTLSFPSDLSPASFQDLQAYLQLFLRKAQRRAGAGDYFAEIYAPDGIKAKVARYFDDFEALKGFLDEFKKQSSKDILRVHLPARAADEERKIVAESGATPI